MAGCALVLGDVPPLREVWDDAALYVTPGDGQALARELGRLIDDHAMRKVFAARAAARASRYTLHGMADAYAGVYTRMREVALA